MNAQEIQTYLQMLGVELQQRGVTGEIVLVGGAVMLLVIGNRPTTKDIDAYFAVNSQAIRSAAQVIAQREHLPPDWLNDAVKGFFFTQPPTNLWLDYPGLRVYVAAPEYVLAMKAVAGRPEDVPDIQALAAHLNIAENSVPDPESLPLGICTSKPCSALHGADEAEELHYEYPRFQHSSRSV